MDFWLREMNSGRWDFQHISKDLLRTIKQLNKDWLLAFDNKLKKYAVLVKINAYYKPVLFDVTESEIIERLKMKIEYVNNAAKIEKEIEAENEYAKEKKAEKIIQEGADGLRRHIGRYN